MMTNSGSTARPLRIVLAAGSEDTVSTLSTLLAGDGYEVRAAADVQQVLQVAADFSPDVAILDTGTPTWNAYDVAKRMVSRVPNVALIALSGWSQSDQVERGRRAGFSYHVSKPVDPRCIRTILATIAHGAA